MKDQEIKVGKRVVLVKNSMYFRQMEGSKFGKIVGPIQPLSGDKWVAVEWENGTRYSYPPSHLLAYNLVSIGGTRYTVSDSLDIPTDIVLEFANTPKYLTRMIESGILEEVNE